MKIRCLALDSGILSSNSYQTLKGNTYLFHRGIATEIPDKDDAAYFLRAGNGKLFEEVSLLSSIKEKVADKVENVLNPNKPKIYTENEIKQMNRQGQVELIKKLGGNVDRTPAKEAGRIKMILQLQDEMLKKSEDKKEVI